MCDHHPFIAGGRAASLDPKEGGYLGNAAQRILFTAPRCRASGCARVVTYRVQPLAPKPLHQRLQRNHYTSDSSVALAPRSCSEASADRYADTKGFLSIRSPNMSRL